MAAAEGREPLLRFAPKKAGEDYKNDDNCNEGCHKCGRTLWFATKGCKYIATVRIGVQR
jgi:hypothetical protein